MARIIGFTTHPFFKSSIVDKRRTSVCASKRGRSRNVRPCQHKAVLCSLTPHLERLVQLQDLTREEAHDAMMHATSGSASESELAAFLSLLSMKGETTEEIKGFHSFMKEHMIPIETSRPLLEIVGTGVDSSNTINVSTAAGIVCATAGCMVVKHGSHAMSPTIGSADLLKALGAELSLTPAGIAQTLDRTCVGFMHARHHHPKLAALLPVMSKLPFRTMWHTLRPLLNPAGAAHVVLGVSDARLMDTMADVLLASNVRRAAIVYGDGLDYFTTTAPCDVIYIDRGEKKRTIFDAEKELGIPRASLSDLCGGDAEYNASAIRQVLLGRGEQPIIDAIALNAAIGCWTYGMDPSFGEALNRVRFVLASGLALYLLEEWVEETRNAPRL